MNLVDVCNWLINRDMENIATAMTNALTNHVWTVDGMLRTDVIEDIFNMYDNSLFHELECDVITYIELIPEYEAHVD
jgi:hypothetical protein